MMPALFALEVALLVGAALAFGLVTYNFAARPNLLGLGLLFVTLALLCAGVRR
jgi:high-affinity Fe2+/Pb2+ permease